MFDKLFEAQKMAEESKKRLDSITVEAQIEGGKIKVVATGNREIREIKIDPEFFNSLDREGVEELVITAVNQAIHKAEQVNQAEMQSMSKDLLGGMGGLGGLSNLFGGNK